MSRCDAAKKWIGRHSCGDVATAGHGGHFANAFTLAFQTSFSQMLLEQWADQFTIFFLWHTWHMLFLRFRNYLVSQEHIPKPGGVLLAIACTGIETYFVNFTWAF